VWRCSGCVVAVVGLRRWSWQTARYNSRDAMLRTRELVVVSPAHQGIGGLVGCGGAGKSMLGNKLEHARRMSNFHQRSRRGCARYLTPTVSQYRGPGLYPPSLVLRSVDWYQATHFRLVGIQLQSTVLTPSFDVCDATKHCLLTGLGVTDKHGLAELRVICESVK